MHSFFLWLYSFLMVVQLFKNIHMRTKEFVQLWKKLYILVQTPLSMKLRAKESVPKRYSVPKMYIFFSLVLQLFNGCTAFQKYTYEDHRICTALENTVHFGTHTIVNEIKSQQQFTKMYSFFLWLYSFLMTAQLLNKYIHVRTTLFVQLWKNCTLWYKHH